MKNTLKLTAVILALFVLVTSVNAHGKSYGKKKDIVTTAVEAGTFKTLAAALTETGLVEALQGDGPFTVFAPTDEAFARLPEGTVEALLKDKEALKSILLYHVVNGKVKAKDVVKLKRAKTLSEKDVKVRVVDGTVLINGSKVVTTDVMASNGVIHVIDTVLLPPTE